MSATEPDCRCPGETNTFMHYGCDHNWPRMTWAEVVARGRGINEAAIARYAQPQPKEPSMFRPLHNHVLVRRHQAEATTPSGLHLPQQAQEKRCEAVVLAVGPGKTLDNGTVVPVPVLPGDTVLFGKWGGQEIEVYDEKLLVMNADEILGVLDANGGSDE